MDFLTVIREEAEKLAAEQGLELYDVEWLMEGKNHILRISLDIPDRAIDVDTCGEFSEKFTVILDEHDLIAQAYYLEVCSPGAERKLRNFEEIKEAQGDYVYVKMKDPKAGMFEVTGDLVEVTEEAVTISYKDKTRTKSITIDINNIALIRLAIKF